MAEPLLDESGRVVLEESAPTRWFDGSLVRMISLDDGGARVEEFDPVSKEWGPPPPPFDWVGFMKSPPASEAKLRERGVPDDDVVFDRFR